MTTPHDRAVLHQILNPLMPTTEQDIEEKDLEKDNIQHEGYEESVKLELEGMKLAESKNLDDAILKFTEAHEKCPVSPSPLNNRAQAYRLKDRVEEALTDLNECLKLTNPRSKTACQAYVQRASIYRLKGDDDRARDDFQKASELGSSFAKMQLVTLNPYAAMCNKMLAEVFDKVKNNKE